MIAEKDDFHRNIIFNSEWDTLKEAHKQPEIVK